ncbi:hypothetical protein E2562_030231 [Oryza meyeriana var. granulata]|uniref:Uncharacterized protein n=1 Tax=Oryza meyeriana var. granulata TaxID=110450 RepID=A0A6G1D855_9ORYZ|nr:hypothetical protein E2562_030231 [Oryza meyeriana var. granulata]
MDFLYKYVAIWHQLSLAELKGYLVLVYHQRYRSSTLDLCGKWWLFLERRTRWSKQESVRGEVASQSSREDVRLNLVKVTRQSCYWQETGDCRNYINAEP